MTLGTGVLLSSLVLGLVWLYVVTRDRWKWKKIVLRSLAFAVGLALITGAGTYAYITYQDRPQVADSLWDIRLGITRSDVKFAKGEPSSAEKDNPSIKDSTWFYKANDVAYGIYFKDDKVARVAAIGKRSSLPSLPGLTLYETLDTITEKLGAPAYISRSKNELKRIYSFPKFNLALGIERGEVNMVVVGVTDDWPVQLVDEADR